MDARRLIYRLYSDILLTDRLGEWRLLLERALERGYLVHSIRSAWDLLKADAIGSDSKVLVLRHDVDTDPGTAARMWEIERSLHIRGSYYFRLSTVDTALMRRIEEGGGEAGYHYEEVAAVAKRRGLATRSEVLSCLDLIRETFADNLRRLRERTGLPIRIVASHGDWLNRRLGVPNTVLLDDPSFREHVGVDLEVYDQAFMASVTSRCSDALYPMLWKPRDPSEAIRAGERFVYVLVHPRHWHANLRENLASDLIRAWETAAFHLKTLRPARRD